MQKFNTWVEGKDFVEEEYGVSQEKNYGCYGN